MNGSPIATADDRRADAGIGQQPRQGEYQRSLAAAANGDIADDNNGPLGPFRRLPPAARGNQAIEWNQRTQAGRRPLWLIPHSVQSALKVCPHDIPLSYWLAGAGA